MSIRNWKNALIALFVASAMAFGTASAQATTTDQPVTLSAAQRAVYVGTYTFRFTVESQPRTLTVHIAEDSARLLVWAEGKPKSVLVPFGNHVFGLKENARLRLTFTVDSGRVTRALLVEPDENGNLGRLDGVPSRSGQPPVDVISPEAPQRTSARPAPSTPGPRRSRNQ